MEEKNSLESLGNKALLEKSVNIRAADYRFDDKKKYYLGFTNDKGKYKDGTQIIELKNFALTKNDYTEVKKLVTLLQLEVGVGVSFFDALYQVDEKYVKNVFIK